MSVPIISRDVIFQEDVFPCLFNTNPAGTQSSTNPVGTISLNPEIADQTEEQEHDINQVEPTIHQPKPNAV